MTRETTDHSSCKGESAGSVSSALQSSSPSALVIRPATHADAALLAALVRELAAFENLEHECVLTPAAVTEHLLGLNRSAEALVAEIDGLPAGFAVYYRTFSTFAARPGVYLEDLYVRPAFRHRGVGTALLKHVGAIAARNKAGRLEWTTLKWNENARRLYASLGAEEKSEWLLLRLEGEKIAALAGEKPEPGEGHSCCCGKNG